MSRNINIFSADRLGIEFMGKSDAGDLRRGSHYPFLLYSQSRLCSRETAYLTMTSIFLSQVESTNLKLSCKDSQNCIGLDQKIHVKLNICLAFQSSSMIGFHSTDQCLILVSILWRKRKCFDNTNTLILRQAIHDTLSWPSLATLKILEKMPRHCISSKGSKRPQKGPRIRLSFLAKWHGRSSEGQKRIVIFEQTNRGHDLFLNRNTFSSRKVKPRYVHHHKRLLRWEICLLLEFINSLKGRKTTCHAIFLVYDDTDWSL